MALNGQASQPPLASLEVYTHNVSKVLKPSESGELAHAVHETLHYALDGDPSDFLVPRSHGSTAPSCDGAGPSQGTVVADASTPDDIEEGEMVQPGFVPTGDPERPYASYLWNDKTSCLTLPHPKTVINPILNDPCTTSDNEQDLRNAFDVTTKFFYLSTAQEADRAESTAAAYPTGWLDEALDCLSTATGLHTVDTLILAFPKLGLDQTDAEGSAVHRKVEQAAQVWRHVSPSPRVLSMGLSDVNLPSLRAFLVRLQPPHCCDDERQREEAKSTAEQNVVDSMVKKGIDKLTPGQTNGGQTSPIRIPSSPSQAALGQKKLEGGEDLEKVYGPGACRRPRICTINLREQRCDDNSMGGTGVSNTSAAGSNCWDRGLAQLCKEEQIQLVAHSDQKDLLPEQSLPTLLREFDGKVPHAMAPGKMLLPIWCLKYTVLIRDRGVLADKGFILFCRAVDAP